jgi:hypothetical protein
VQVLRRAMRQTTIILFTCELGFGIQDPSTLHYLLGIARRGGLPAVKFAADCERAIFRNQQISCCSGLGEIKLFEPCGIDDPYHIITEYAAALRRAAGGDRAERPTWFLLWTRRRNGHAQGPIQCGNSGFQTDEIII